MPRSVRWIDPMISVGSAKWARAQGLDPGCGLEALILAWAKFSSGWPFTWHKTSGTFGKNEDPAHLPNPLERLGAIRESKLRRQAASNRWLPVWKEELSREQTVAKGMPQPVLPSTTRAEDDGGEKEHRSRTENAMTEEGRLWAYIQLTVCT